MGITSDLYNTNADLRRALWACVMELERLHEVHGEQYAGKIGAPNLDPVRQARRLIGDSRTPPRL